jgi:hypothetical protein
MTRLRRLVSLLWPVTCISGTYPGEDWRSVSLLWPVICIFRRLTRLWRLVSLLWPVTCISGTTVDLGVFTELIISATFMSEIEFNRNGENNIYKLYLL